MPKNTKKRTRVKELSRPEQELTAKAAKKVKGGLLPAVKPAGVENPTQPSSLGATAQKVKIGGAGGKGGFTLGQLPGGLQ